MDDEARVGVGHGLADLHEHLHARLGAQPGRVGGVGDGRALGDLHHHVRRALGVDAGVVEARDAGVLEARERPLLRGEAAGVRAPEARPQPLQRDGPLVEPVGALGAVDDAHAALAEQPRRPPGPDGPRQRVVRARDRGDR